MSWNSDSVIAGRIRWRSPSIEVSPVVHQPIAVVSPRPYDGSQPSITANTRISRMPIRNVGSDTPSSDSVSSVCANQLLRRNAV